MRVLLCGRDTTGIHERKTLSAGVTECCSLDANVVDSRAYVLIVAWRFAMKITPMMQQYLDAKSEHPDCLVLFRLGDFYELFHDDAVLVAGELELTLTSRDRDAPNPTPMCGVPYHAIDGYIRRLLEKGYSVALCEQLEDPASVKGLVRRGVTRVITPGMRLDSDSLDAKTNNFSVAVAISDLKNADTFAIGAMDVSTGEFRVLEAMSMDSLASEVLRLAPAEILMTEGQSPFLEGHFAHLPIPLVRRPNDRANIDRILKGQAATALHMPLDGRAMETRNLEETRSMIGAIDAYAMRDRRAVEMSVALLLDRAIETQGGIPKHLDAPAVERSDQYLELDEFSSANLELFETLMGGRKKGTLFSTIDQTVTSAGGRRLRTWLAYPLQSVPLIVERQSRVTALVKQPAPRTRLRDLLKRTSDIQRISSKMAGGQGNARDLVALRLTLEAMPEVASVTRDLRHEALNASADLLTSCADLAAMIAVAIVDEPPIGLQEGELIRRGFDADLDVLIDLSTTGKQWLVTYEAKERKRSGIPSLKVKHNRVFGFYIEITRANLDQVPDDYIRKQTLANAERYFTPELKDYEDNILSANDRRIAKEFQIFETIRRTVIDSLGRIRRVASEVAELDAVAALAELAHRGDYVAPLLREEPGIVIEDGRHPVVETMLRGERFVPNDIRLLPDERLLLITGPNMAGKSTVIRQVALICLLAQIGSYVPARSATIGVVDQIFSRVGASDNLARGQSTFMVEMSEVARILTSATNRSLIILDEIGRGTATWDGLSIAWSVAEHLHDTIGAFTLFATHYHELTELTRTRDGVRNYNIAVREWNDEIIFLRKLLEGPANRSYGIQVARLAGVPESVVERAKVILHNLESQDLDADLQPKLAREYKDGQPVRKVSNQLALFAPEPMDVTIEGRLVEHPLMDDMRKLNVSRMTPLDALVLLDRWQKRLESEDVDRGDR